MINGDQLKYYWLEKLVFIFVYIIGFEQVDSYIKADFFCNFVNGFNYMLDYDCIMQFGENMQYFNQNVCNIIFNNGFWFQYFNNCYEAFFSVVVNII